MFVSAIIVAAGKGQRLKSHVPKQFIHIGQKPILAYTLEKFENCDLINEILLVTALEDIEYCRKQVTEAFQFPKVKVIVPGGSHRQDSVYRGLLQISVHTDIVLVHDGVRPFIKTQMILDCIKAAITHGAGILGIPLKDTVKICDSDQFVTHTPMRESLCAIQTPQAFRAEILKQAYEQARKDHFVGTDDSVLVERIGCPVKLLQGSYKNIKITTEEDLILANHFLSGVDGD